MDFFSETGKDPPQELLESGHGHDDAHGGGAHIGGNDHHEGGHGEPWLVSYADLMTLLFGFFVLMYVFASATEKQKEAIKKSVSEYAGGEYTTEFREVAASLTEKIKEVDVDGEVSVFDSLDGVRIVSRGTLFFDSGSVVLKPKAASLINDIAKILIQKAGAFVIIVEGHTDDSPISTQFIPSNWELSALRAGTVVRIFEQVGLQRQKLRAMGLADTVPVLPNRDPKGRPVPANQAENRRIVIHIKRVEKGT
ncbi:MAG: flagellar motor protein MotB [Bdellovibrionota bacterium]